MGNTPSSSSSGRHNANDNTTTTTTTNVTSTAPLLQGTEEEQPILVESQSSLKQSQPQGDASAAASTSPMSTTAEGEDAPEPAPRQGDSEEGRVEGQFLLETDSLSDSFWDEEEDDDDDNDDDNGRRRRRRRRFSWRRLMRRVCRVCLIPLTDQTGSPSHLVAGLAVVFFWGTLLGVLVPTSIHSSSTNSPSNVMARWYEEYGSGILGYTYFMAWSISFYPQVILNFQRRTTVGLSLDFCAWNVLGFACYALYNTLLFTNPALRRQYRAWHNDMDVSIASNDVAFSVHAWVLTSIILGQVWYFDYQSTRVSSSRRRTTIPPPVSPLLKWGLATVLAALVAMALLIACWKPTSSSLWLRYLYGLSTVKIAVSIWKYIPQVLLNYRRRSTVGWNIWNIVLDFTGGVLSLAQLMGDAALVTHDWSAITGNLAKFGLGFVSLGFDIIFMVQHYVLYTDHGTSNHRHSLLVHANTLSEGQHEHRASMTRNPSGMARSMSV